MVEVAEVEKLEFKWGKKRGIGGKKKDVQFYESFMYDGVEYALYDSVYLYKEEEPEPYIGKLIKIWENSDKTKRVKVLWFFRPNEILNFIGNYPTRENELFLACGEGVGLANVNPLEAIAGKCNVICTSKDRRNRQPSDEELQLSDFIFYRTFDVGLCKVLDKIDEKIAGIEVKFIFNRADFQRSDSALKVDKNAISSCKVEFEKSKAKGGKGLEVKEEVKSTKDLGELDNRPSKKSKLDSSMEVYDDKMKNSMQNLGHDFERKGEKRKIGIINNEDKSKTKMVIPENSHEIDRGPSKKLKVDEELTTPTNGKLTKTSSIQPSIVEKKTDKQVPEVARRPNLDRSKWFKELPWEERLQIANEQGTLVLLENLDPSYTSIEVEDIVWHAFKEKCSAKMIQRIVFSSPHSGQAFVIFKTREATERVVTKLDEGCLMLPNGSPLVGSIRTPCFTGKQSAFVGHLVIDKLKFQMQREMREAVSTSHCSQPNTLEYDMAVEWCVQQEKLHRAWKKLYEQQGRELRKLKAKLKPK